MDLAAIGVIDPNDEGARRVSACDSIVKGFLRLGPRR
jgi:hypothetical protein